MSPIQKAVKIRTVKNSHESLFLLSYFGWVFCKYLGNKGAEKRSKYIGSTQYKYDNDASSQSWLNGFGQVTKIRMTTAIVFIVISIF